MCHPRRSGVRMRWRRHLRRGEDRWRGGVEHQFRRLDRGRLSCFWWLRQRREHQPVATPRSDQVGPVAEDQFAFRHLDGMPRPVYGVCRAVRSVHIHRGIQPSQVESRRQNVAIVLRYPWVLRHRSLEFDLVQNATWHHRVRIHSTRRAIVRGWFIALDSSPWLVPDNWRQLLHDPREVDRFVCQYTQKRQQGHHNG